MTQVAVYATPEGDPQQVWVLPADSDELPESASVPGMSDPQALAFNFKGDRFTWLDWAQALADSPALGNWSVLAVPDEDSLGQPTSAQEALGFARMHALDTAAEAAKDHP